MSLTERELDDALQWMRRDCYLRNVQNANGRRGLAATLYLDRLETRAKRLLPLWRKLGLKQLTNNARAEGYVCGVDDARYGRFS